VVGGVSFEVGEERAAPISWVTEFAETFALYSTCIGVTILREYQTADVYSDTSANE
jgi:hypothetical protein